ncbi:MAG TPA: hypothetical protein VFS33_01030 [Gemmatimonadales bacterium]|nr:hypothetical protein [Gemmatimonadales bacterium]
MVKLGDKICNLLDVTNQPPSNWDLARRREYLDWTEQVIAGCRGVNAGLEAYYDRVLAAGRSALGPRPLAHSLPDANIPLTPHQPSRRRLHH